MNTTLEYKGYIGSVEFSEEDNILYGQVLGVRALISYEGITPAALIQDFHESIDDYLEVCKAHNITPEKSYKGTFNIRIKPELHKAAAIYSMENQTSLNKFVETAIEHELLAVHATI